MPEMMNALVAYAPYDYRYERVPVPQLGPGEILLKVSGCGICAGDIKAYHGGIRIWGSTPEDRYIEAPVIGGHEFCGKVADMAPDVHGFQIGDLLVTEQILPCRACKFCHSGQYWMCTGSAVFGFKQRCQGGFAEYVKLPASSLKHNVPDSFSTEQAVLIEPIACGMHAVERADIRHNDVVVVSGLGAIGLSMLNLVSLRFPRHVIGVDVCDQRLAKAKAFGAHTALNPAHCDLTAEILALTDGLGCDVYIEASGNPRSVKQGLDALCNLGRFVQMGVFAEEVSADWNIIGDGKELKIIGSHLSALTYPAVIEGIQRGLIKTDGLISHKFALKDWHAAFEMAENSSEAMKVMLIPHA